MCACVLKKVASEVGKVIGDRDYVPCSGVLQTTADVTLKRLVLRKERRNFFSRHLKGPYKYKFMPMSLGDYGVLIETGELGGDTAASARPSLLNDDSLVSDKFLAEYRLNSFTDSESSARVATLGDSVVVEAGLNTSDSKSTSLSYLNVRRIEGSNLERLILELQSKWRFNKEHRLWKYITGQDKYELCFISSIVSTQKKLTLQCKHSASGEITALADKLFELSLGVSTATSHYLVLPAGAALTYKLQHLEIDPSSGRITVPLGKMETSDEQDNLVDPETEIEDCRRYYSDFFGRLSTEKQDSLRKAIIKLFPFDTALPTCDTLGENQDIPQQESNCGSSDNSSLTADAISKDRQCLARRLKKMAKAALPTNVEPKEKEIADLLQALGVPGFLDLPKERAAVNGIRYFLVALLQLPPGALSLLRDTASADGDGLQYVTKLEDLIESKADGTECKKMEPFSLDTAMDDESFLYAWRAAYVATVHMFGLPAA